MPPKKSFKAENPTLQFISTEAIEAVEHETDTKANVQESIKASTSGNSTELPTGYVLKPESKSRRVQTLIQPSVYEKLKTIADNKGISTNEAINNAIREYVERN